MNAALFVHPEWVVAIVAACLAACVGTAIARVRQTRRRRALGTHTRPSVSVARDVVLVAALAATGLALLGPRVGETLVRLPAAGADVVLLLDVSRSMAATDVAASRLGAAQAASREILARLSPGDRAALAIFASRGVLLAPLTPDFEALAEIIDALDTQLIEPSGSQLAAGVTTALEAFEIGSDRSRHLFVLSDGESPRASGSLGTAAARNAEVSVIAIGFGSDAGANVPYATSNLRDADGALVISRRDMRRLSLLAEATGGAAFAAGSNGSFDSSAAMRGVRAEAADVEGRWIERRVPAVRVEPLAALAILLLAWESVARRRMQQRVVSLALCAACSLLVAAAPSDPREASPALAVDPRELSSDPAELIAFGLERVELLDYSVGMRALQSAALSAEDSELAALAWYDLGVAALESGDLERARDAFFDALALTPFDREARFNLEWTLNALQDQPPTPTLPPPPAASQAPAPPAPATKPETKPADQPTQASGGSASVDTAEARRLLLQVDDDLRRALLSATQTDAPRSRHMRPAW